MGLESGVGEQEQFSGKTVVYSFALEDWTDDVVREGQ